MKKLFILSFIFLLSSCSSTIKKSTGKQWVLKDKFSRISIITTKNNSISEVSEFKKFSGEIKNNYLQISIDLQSLETNIPIRNERIAEHLFETVLYPTADIHTQLKPEDLNQGIHNISFDVDFHGVSAIIEAEFLVTEYYSNKIVILQKPLIIHAKMFGLEQGINKLKNIAHLQSIDFTVPVDITLEFEEK